MKYLQLAAIFLGFSLLTACHSEKAAGGGEKIAKTASLYGSISYHGHIQSLEQKDWCDKQQDSMLKVGEKGQLAEALITLGSSALETIPAVITTNAVPKSANIIVNECTLSPRQLIVAGDGQILLTNQDTTSSHNIYLIHNKAIVNQVTLPPATTQPFSLTRTGFYQLGELRKGRWLYTTIYAADEPLFATSDEAGHYSFSALPPGEYQLHIRHQILGEIGKVVNLLPGDNEKQYSAF